MIKIEIFMSSLQVQEPFGLPVCPVELAHLQVDKLPKNFANQHASDLPQASFVSHVKFNRSKCADVELDTCRLQV